MDGRRSSSMFSGISPGASRMGSVDDGVSMGARKRSEGRGPGMLSREVSRDDGPGIVQTTVGTVTEE